MLASRCVYERKSHSTDENSSERMMVVGDSNHVELSENNIQFANAIFSQFDASPMIANGADDYDGHTIVCGSVALIVA